MVILKVGMKAGSTEINIEYGHVARQGRNLAGTLLVLVVCLALVGIFEILKNV